MQTFIPLGRSLPRVPRFTACSWLPCGKFQLRKHESYLCPFFGSVFYLDLSAPTDSFKPPLTLNIKWEVPPKNVALKTKVPGLGVPFRPAVEALFLQLFGETGRSSHPPSHPSCCRHGRDPGLILIYFQAR